MEQEISVKGKKSVAKREDSEKKLIPFLDEPYNAEFEEINSHEIESNRAQELERENIELRVNLSMHLFIGNNQRDERRDGNC